MQKEHSNSSHLQAERSSGPHRPTSDSYLLCHWGPRAKESTCTQLCCTQFCQSTSAAFAGVHLRSCCSTHQPHSRACKWHALQGCIPIAHSRSRGEPRKPAVKVCTGHPGMSLQGHHGGQLNVQGYLQLPPALACCSGWAYISSGASSPSV